VLGVVYNPTRPNQTWGNRYNMVGASQLDYTLGVISL